VDTEIKVVIFDLGRVLVDFDHRIAAQKISKLSHKSPQEIFDLFFNSPLIQLFEEGKSSPEDFFAAVSRTLGLNIGFAEFLPVWNQIFFVSEENKAVYGLGKSLKARYRLALLSNINVLHFKYLKENFPVFDIFHDIFASCEMGCIKPSPEIYRKVISSLKVSPGEIFYTDDRPELVEQANSLGIRGFVFKSSRQLKDDLASCGVKSDEES
jgi:FMN phosphatase YigB (HAD superfamily)